MRILIPAAVLALSVSCARLGAPPGGPEDTTPPRPVGFRPAADSTGVGLAPELAVTFSEPVEKQTAQRLIELSPSPGRLIFEWDGPVAEIAPEDSLRPEVTYRLRVRQGVTDLRRVTNDTAYVSYFSTGDEFDPGEITGRVTHADTGVFGAVVRAAWMKDSTLVYDTYSDSAGAYRLPYLKAGGYRVRAFRDANNNGEFDYTREPGADTLLAVRIEPERLDIELFIADTTAPILQTVEAVDSLTVRLAFDDALDTLQNLTPERFELRSPDAALAIDSAKVNRAEPSNVLLYPAAPLAADSTYFVAAQGITNRAGLTMDRASRTFTFTPATDRPPAGRRR